MCYNATDPLWYINMNVNEENAGNLWHTMLNNDLFISFKIKNPTKIQLHSTVDGVVDGITSKYL